MNTQELKRRIIEKRISMGFTQKKLAKKLNITPSNLCKIEKGRIPKLLSFMENCRYS